jgi:hypothetical protein
MRVKLGEGELGIKDMYSFYKQNTPNPLSYKEYKEVVYPYLDGIMDLIIHQGHTHKLSAFLGSFRIQKTPINYEKLNYDWHSYKTTGIKTFHLNQHSDGFKVRFVWSKKDAILKPHAKRPYSFVLSRYWKRELAKRMKTKGGHEIYPQEIITATYD